MGNDLVLRSDFQAAFPGIAAGLRRAQEVFDRICSFQDIEDTFLKGAGLSANTYRCYLVAVKQLYDFTGGKHPLQITAADIEAYYDNVLKTADLNTAAVRMAGLRRFFKGGDDCGPLLHGPLPDNAR